jgi:hypothetical protein
MDLPSRERRIKELRQGEASNEAFPQTCFFEKLISLPVIIIMIKTDAHN